MPLPPRAALALRESATALLACAPRRPVPRIAETAELRRALARAARVARPALRTVARGAGPPLAPLPDFRDPVGRWFLARAAAGLAGDEEVDAVVRHVTFLSHYEDLRRDAELN